jgi:hypothetical protein
MKSTRAITIEAIRTASCRWGWREGGFKEDDEQTIRTKRRNVRDELGSKITKPSRDRGASMW